MKEAMRHYEMAGTAAKDIPRMLFRLGKIEILNTYASKTDDPALLLWWAQYQESNQAFDAAMDGYRRAKDHLSLVRVLCLTQDFEGAAHVVAATKSRAAAYHLARQFEAQDDIARAIQFYATSGGYSHAIRLSREHQMDGDLMQYALLSKPAQMIECAQYFETKRELEKAVVLYHKGGHLSRAIEVCFQASLFDELHVIADELAHQAQSTTPSNQVNPLVLSQCADFFAKHGHYEKAVPLLLLVHRFDDALNMCVAQKVKITEDMADKLTPAKPASETDTAANKKRMDTLMKLAKCCKQQGAYHLATKKYTQAGAKVKAMKCLLKSGDTEKVVFFANVSRNNDIFVLAGNYLQTLQWHGHVELTKNIVGFYTKAKAFDALAAFYEANATLEIEEGQHYEKAVACLKEAVKALERTSNKDKEKRIARMESRMEGLETLIQAHAAGAMSNPREMVAKLERYIQHLQDHQDNDHANDMEQLCLGEAYKLLVEHAFENQELSQVSALLENMRARKLNVKKYISNRILSQVQMVVRSSTKIMEPEEKVAKGREDLGWKTSASNENEDEAVVDEEMEEEIETAEDSPSAAHNKSSRNRPMVNIRK